MHSPGIRRHFRVGHDRSNLDLSPHTRTKDAHRASESAQNGRSKVSYDREEPSTNTRMAGVPQGDDIPQGDDVAAGAPQGGDITSATGEELRPFFGRTLLPSVLDRAFKGEL